MIRFDQIIDENETIIETIKPHKGLYIFGSWIIYVFGIVWLFLDLKFMRFTEEVGGSFDLFILVHLFPFWYALFSPIYRLIIYPSISYCITDRHIYLTSGVFGQDYVSLEYKDLADVSVNVSPLQNMCHVGTIQLTPDQTTGVGENRRTVSGKRMISIPHPYETFRLIKKLRLDVTTDQQYPNAYRPQNNPGYQTKIDDLDHKN